MLIIAAAAYSQAYRPLPQSDAKWCIIYNNHIMPPPPWWYTNYWETYYAGDTLIQDVSYIKIFKTEYDIFCLQQIIAGPDYIGAIRDDTISRKVYLVPPGQENEELIYDFSLHAGDTLYSYLNYYEPIVIDNTDSVWIGQSYFKSLNFPYGEGSEIEGVGSISGFMEELISFEGGSSLCALYIDTNLIFPQSPCNIVTDTCLNVGISEEVLSKDFADVYPNPASTSLTIELNGVQPEGFRVHILNLMGEEILTKTLENSSTKIDLNGYVPGVYLMKL